MNTKKVWYLIRNKKRADGSDIDVDSIVTTTTLANALNKYYTYKAAAVADTTYYEIGICLLDRDLNVVEQCVVPQYVDPDTAPATTA